MVWGKMHRLQHFFGKQIHFEKYIVCKYFKISPVDDAGNRVAWTFSLVADAYGHPMFSARSSLTLPVNSSFPIKLFLLFFSPTVILSFVWFINTMIQVIKLLHEKNWLFHRIHHICIENWLTMIDFFPSSQRAISLI